ncbi:MAG TPA: hypothetical protein VHX15_21700 [Frankiaceae bacterium]|nr:hypothetical protein [Frankiaceae bacterium]
MRRFGTFTAALTCAGVLAAGCASSTTAKFTAQTTTLDDGTLTITTARPQTTVISQTAAEYDLAHSTLGGARWAQQQVEFGYVTVKPSALKAYNNPGEAVPAAPTHLLSWVLFYEAGKSNCGNGGLIPSPSFTVAHPSKKLAMIVDAATGTALNYEGASSGNCVTRTAPGVTYAGGNVSVPWKDNGGSDVIATYPPCVQPGGGTPGETDSTGTTFAVLGSRLYAPCHAKATTSQLPVNFPRPWKHSPVGPIATGTSG